MVVIPKAPYVSQHVGTGIILIVGILEGTFPNPDGLLRNSSLAYFNFIGVEIMCFCRMRTVPENRL